MPGPASLRLEPLGYEDLEGFGADDHLAAFRCFEQLDLHALRNNDASVLANSANRFEEIGHLGRGAAGWIGALAGRRAELLIEHKPERNVLTLEEYRPDCPVPR